ncbi:MAG: helix-turn-helix domain-containing protein [Desulfovibrio sp.]|nr:helix-turn-helix domain-containing protein [Desulfovibrio sp.]
MSKPGEKLLALYTLLMLRGQNPISLSELARILHCSKQTVLRYLDQLEASGYGKLEEPIVRGREHLYRMAPIAQPHLALGVRELSQLTLCRKMLLPSCPRKPVLCLRVEIRQRKTNHLPFLKALVSCTARGILTTARIKSGMLCFCRPCSSSASVF